MYQSLRPLCSQVKYRCIIRKLVLDGSNFGLLRAGELLLEDEESNESDVVIFKIENLLRKERRRPLGGLCRKFPRLGLIDTTIKRRRACNPSNPSTFISDKLPAVSFLRPLEIRLYPVCHTWDALWCQLLIRFEGNVDVISASSTRQVDASSDIAMGAIRTSLAALQVGSAFATKIPYIAPVAGLLLQALAMRDASRSYIPSNNVVF